MRRLKLILLLVLGICIATSGVAAAEETADTLLAKIMLKLISLDKNIDRYGNTIKIGVTDDGMLIALRSMYDTTIMGKPFTADKIVLSRDVANYHVVYINSGLKRSLDEIVQIANEKKILTFVSDKNYLKQGFAIALEIEEELPVIWMNLANASKIGCDISTSSLTLVIVKGFIKD